MSFEQIGKHRNKDLIYELRVRHEGTPSYYIGHFDVDAAGAGAGDDRNGDGPDDGDDGGGDDGDAAESDGDGGNDCGNDGVVDGDEESVILQERNDELIKRPYNLKHYGKEIRRIMQIAVIEKRKKIFAYESSTARKHRSIDIYLFV